MPKTKPSAVRPSYRFIPKKYAWLLYVLVVMWVARNTVFIRQRADAAYAAVDTMAILQIGIVLAIIAVILQCPYMRAWRRIKGTSLKYYFFYYLLSAVFALWSINPKYSLYRSVEVLALSAGVLLFCLSDPDIQKCIQRTRIMVWTTIILFILSVVRLKGLGPILQDNGLGAAAAMSACFFLGWVLAVKAGNNRKRLIQGGASTVLVVITMSLASWWSFWFGIVYCSLFTRRKGLIIALFLCGATLFFMLGTDTRENLLIRDKTIEQVLEGHGRKMLWENYLEVSGESPLVGFGFAMGAREVGAYYKTNTHNTFFAALLGMGWIGVGVWVLFIGSFLSELFQYRHSSNPVWLGCAAALAAGGLNSMSLSILGEQWHPATTVFMAFLSLHAGFVLQAKRTRAVKARQAAAPRNARRTNASLSPASPVPAPLNADSHRP